MKFNRDGSFSAQFKVDSKIDGATEIYFMEKIHYKNGYTLGLFVNGSKSEAFEIDTQRKNYIRVKAKDSSVDGKLVDVVLTPK